MLTFLSFTAQSATMSPVPDAYGTRGPIRWVWAHAS
jgi:hypothetical protein